MIHAHGLGVLDRLKAFLLELQRENSASGSPNGSVLIARPFVGGARPGRTSPVSERVHQGLVLRAVR